MNQTPSSSSPLAHQFLDALIPEDVTRNWHPNLIANLNEKLQPINIKAGTVLFTQDDTGSEMYLLHSGTLDVTLKRADGNLSVIDSLGPGDIVGEMAVLTHHHRTATVTARTDCQLLGLSRADFEQIGEAQHELVEALGQLIIPRLHRVQLVAVLTGIFGEMDPAAIQTLQDELTWVHLDAGQFLMRKGDAGDALYIVVYGLMKAIESDRRGGYRVLSEIGRGETVGEVALLTEAPRTADVMAARYTSLVRLSVDSFRRIILDYPEALMTLSGRVLRRISEDASSALDRQTQLAIALLGDDPDVDTTPLGQQLASALSRYGTTLLLNADSFEEAYGRQGVAQYEGEGPLELALSSWLDDQQTRYQFVIFQADREWTPWSRRCLHQVDRLLIVGDTTHDADVGRLESAANEFVPHCRRELVLLQPAGTRHPTGTKAWLEERDIDTHHHVRLGNKGDMSRLARRLTGRAIGLTLSGGGARGNAHVGTYMALNEANIPVDLIGGTSMGSLIAGMIAIEMSIEEMFAFAEGSSSRSALVDVTFPVSAVAAGQRVNDVYGRLFGDIQIEDLWRPYFAVSCNLNAAMPVVHRTGPLWRAVRSSTAIPGIFPPILDENGELLTDGGVVNNMPTDVMHQLCEGGIIIGSNASPDAEAARGYIFGDHLSGWQTIGSRINPFAQSASVPGLFETIMRSIEVMSIYMRSQGEWNNYHDLMIDLPVEEFGILEFDKYQEIVEVGYQAAKVAIERWDRPP